MSRGAEPLGGGAARRRKRASRGYMLSFARVEHGLTLWQRMLPLKPEQGRTPRTTPSTRFYNRALEVLLLKISAGQPLCSGPQVSRLKPELDAASELRRHRRRGRRGFSLASLDSGSILKTKML